MLVPQLTATLASSKFEIFVASHIFRKSWTHPKLKNLVIQAKTNYERLFGDNAPVTDEYDNKSLHFLLKATYHHKKHRYIEFVTIRFIPAQGIPLLSEDFFTYSYSKPSKHKDLFDLFHKKLPELKILTSSAAKKTIFTQSRLATIKPHNPSKPPLSTSKHTALSFILLNYAFFRYLNAKNLTCLYLTAQMHTKVSDQILRLPADVGIQPTLTYAETVLQLPPKTIKIDRDSPLAQHYIYGYPGYFLDITDLSKLFTQLAQKSLMSKAAISQYLPDGISFKMITKHPRLHYFRNFGKLLTSPGIIPNSKLTGEELRTLVRTQVGDGPKLRLIQAKIYQKQIYKLVSERFDITSDKL